MSVLGGVVVPMADVGCQKKCSAMVKVGLSRFQKLIGELASMYHRYYSRCLENSYNMASVSRLLTTVSKKTTPQLLEHIGLQNIKVAVKTNFGRLATVFQICSMDADILS